MTAMFAALTAGSLCAALLSAIKRDRKQVAASVVATLLFALLLSASLLER